MRIQATTSRSARIPRGSAFSISDTATPGGNGGPTNALFAVKIDAPTSNSVTILFATADGSAHAGSDYEKTNEVLGCHRAPPIASSRWRCWTSFLKRAGISKSPFSILPTPALARAQATGTIIEGNIEPAVADHFDWTAIPSPQHTKVPFDVTVTAIDTNGNVVAAFDRLVAFSTPIADTRFHPAISGTFTNGVWQGQFTVDDPANGLILKADDFGGHSGLSGTLISCPLTCRPRYCLSRPAAF